MAPRTSSGDPSASSSRLSKWLAGVIVSLLVAAGAIAAQANQAPDIEPTSDRATMLGAPASSGPRSDNTSYTKVRARKQSPTLSIEFAAPQGNLRSVLDANELRWLFDRPVVDLGAIAEQPDPSPFVTLKPEIVGSFRWASTRLLIFTPSERLPGATTFTASIKGITGLDGTTLDTPSATTFSTPAARCSVVDAEPPLFRATCDQEVDGASLIDHTTVIYRPGEFDASVAKPSPQDLAEMMKIDASATTALLNEIESYSTRQARSQRVVLVEAPRPCNADQAERFPLCHTLRAAGKVPLDATASLRFGAGIVSKEGPNPSRVVVDGDIKTNRRAFILTDGCTVDCDPLRVSLRTTLDLTPESLSGRLSVEDTVSKTTKTYQIPTGTDSQNLPAELTNPLGLYWAKLLPGHSYRFTVKAGAASSEGTLPYTSITNVSLGQYQASAYLHSEGEQVVEDSLSGLTFETLNVTAVDQVTRRATFENLVPLLRSYANTTTAELIDLKDEVATTRAISQKSNRSKVSKVSLPSKQPGVYLVAIKPTGFEPNSLYGEAGYPAEVTGDGPPSEPTGRSGDGWSSALVQRGDTAVTLKRSPSNVMVAVTALSTGKAISGAPVSLYGLTDKPFWSGVTGTDGLVIAPLTRDTICARTCDLIAVVDATSGLAYAQSYWRAWGDEVTASPEEVVDDPQESLVDPATTLPAPTPPTLEPGERVLASLFTDRGVYRTGEEVHLKGLVRIETPKTLEFPSTIKTTQLSVRDPRDSEIVSKTVSVENGSFDTTFEVPTGGSQGRYYVSIDGGSTSFVVTSFRKPDFVVDVTPERNSYVRGEAARFAADARYLFGAPMAGAPFTGTFLSYAVLHDPVKGKPELGLSDMEWNYSCFDSSSNTCDEGVDLSSEASSVLDDIGRNVAEKPLTILKSRHRPITLQYEANVTDVSRQTFAGRQTTTVHPGDAYVGIRQVGALTDVAESVTVEVAAVTPAGGYVDGLRSEVSLTLWEYITTKRLNEGGTSSTVGAWRATPISKRQMVIGTKPTVASFKATKAGYYEARVSALDARGNYLESNTEVYVLGPGYVPWYAESNDPTVTLISDETTYSPGDVARVLVQSPWPSAEGLLTLERNGVLSSQRFTLKSSASAIDIAITEDLAPNVFATVTLFKGRTAPPSVKDPTDSGRPQIQAGTIEIMVPPTAQTLHVGVQTDQVEYRPGSAATAAITVTDSAGKPASGEVTLYAVDEGILRLTDYQNPNVMDAMYPYRPLEVLTADSRMKLVAQVAGNKGDSTNESLPEPGGGGGEEGDGGGGSSGKTASDVRSDFRLLAAWSANVRVDINGKATVPMKLPDSLTAFRVIAVASSGPEKFGTGQSEITVRKPFLMLPNLPRFVNIGDEFETGVIVRNDTKRAGDATITVSLPSDSPVTIVGPKTVNLTQLSSEPREVRFKLRATGLGAAKFTFKAELDTGPEKGPDTGLGGSSENNSDALVATIPVSVTRRYETVVDTGTVKAGNSSDPVGVKLPKGVEPGLGGLELTMSSSALAGLQEGITSLAEYPYGCLEQRSSRIRVLLDLASLSETYSLPGIKTGTVKKVVQSEITKLSDYRLGSGGLSYWPGGQYADFFLTPRVLLLLQDAKQAGYSIPAGLIDDISSFLQSNIRELDDSDAGSRANREIEPSRGQIAWALARAGEAPVALMDTLFEARHDLPYLEQVHLLRAQLESGLVGDEPDTMLALVLGSIRIDGTEASVQEQYDWFEWRGYSYLQDGAVHDTAAMLGLLSRIDPEHPLIAPLSRWLLRQRTNGSWSNTLESGYALQALLEVARNSEGTDPNFTATVRLGSQELASEKFTGRSLDATTKQISMDELSTIAKNNTAGKANLTVKASGSGTAQYTTRLRYVPTFESLKPVDQGITIERTYHPYSTQNIADSTGRYTAPPATSFAIGDLVEVVIKVTTAEYRRNIVIDDPLPAGLEALNTLLDSTSQADVTGELLYGVDHTEIRDDRVLMFATELSSGTTELRYITRATTSGTFMVAPAQVEDMYRPEIFGHNGSMRFVVKS